jgi:uncharacterized membrane protein YqjE
MKIVWLAAITYGFTVTVLFVAVIERGYQAYLSPTRQNWSVTFLFLLGFASAIWQLWMARQDIIQKSSGESLASRRKV